jgi:hypothetical protein
MALHRAEQILDSVVAILVAASIPAEKYRSTSYDSGELPAVSVRMGPDAPPVPSNIPIIDSEFPLVLVCLAKGATEAEAFAALMDLRKRSHVALMADRTLGLSFVSDCRYLGAGQPEIEQQSTEQASGQLETSWAVPYRMSLADPSA